MLFKYCIEKKQSYTIHIEVFRFKAIVLNINFSILHNFMHIIHIYLIEFYIFISLNFKTYILKELNLNPVCKDKLLLGGNGKQKF